MGEVNFKRRLDKFEGKLETISTYQPFDNILVKFNHMSEAGLLETFINMKYKEHFIVLELNHNGNFYTKIISGKHKIETSFSQLELLEVHYDVKVIEFEHFGAGLSESFPSS